MWMVNQLKVGLDWLCSILWAKFVRKTNEKKKKKGKKKRKRSKYFSLFKRVRFQTFECLHEHEYYVLFMMQSFISPFFFWCARYGFSSLLIILSSVIRNGGSAFLSDKIFLEFFFFFFFWNIYITLNVLLKNQKATIWRRVCQVSFSLILFAALEVWLMLYTYQVEIRNEEVLSLCIPPKTPINPKSIKVSAIYENFYYSINTL